MKTAQELIEINEWPSSEGIFVVSSERAEEIMDEHAEDYVKAFINFAGYEHGIVGLGAAFDEFKESLKVMRK